MISSTALSKAPASTGGSKLVSRLRSLCAIASLLSLYALLLSVIIKKYGGNNTFLSSTEWWVAAGVPGFLCLLFFICSLVLDCFSAPQPAHSFSNTLAVRSFLLRIPVEQLDRYHELSVFRDALFAIIYLFFIAASIAFFVEMTCPPDHHCTTPYTLLALGVLVINSIRLLHLLFHQVLAFRVMRNMCREVRHYQEYLNEHRLFHYVLPDLAETTKLVSLEWTCFACSLTLAILAQVWIANRACATTCPVMFWCAAYFVDGVWAQEGLLVVSEIVLAYFHRVSGVQYLEELAQRIRQDKLRLINPLAH